MTTRKDPQEQLSDMLRSPTPGSPQHENQGTADRMRQRAEEAGHQAADQAREARDRAQETADNLRRRAEDTGRQAGERADSAINTAGDRMHDAARTIRERAPGGQVGDVASQAADALDRGGDYLRSKDVNSMRGDLETIVREHPIQSLAVGFGVGFMIARSMRPRRG